MKIFRLCKKYLLKYKYAIAVYVLLMLLSSALGILSPFIIGNFIDNFVEGADVHDIIRFAFIFGAISVIKIVMGYIASVIYVKMQSYMSYAFKLDTINHIQSLSLSYINKQDSAYLTQRIGADTGSLVSFCVSILQHVISNVVMFVVPFVILLSMNVFISVMLLLFFVAYSFLYLFFKNALYNAGFALKEAQSKFFSSCLERLRYVKLIKINSIHAQMSTRTDAGFTAVKDAAIHNQKVGYTYSGLDGFVSTIAQIVLFIIGGLQILAGNFTIGMFTVFTSYFNMILNSGRYFFGLGAYYQQTMVAYDRMAEIFDHKPEQCGSHVINDIAKIELQNLGFTYHTHEGNNGNKMVINDLSIAFEKGKMYSVAGANGAGKSTLINLIMGLYIDEYSGAIRYDDIDIRQINMWAAREKLIAFSEQEPLLLNDTIKYNLTFDDKDISAPDVSRYLSVLGMEDFISERTLDFVINEKNTNTSGGEKQKISILKALYKNSAVMIFDEPTSALDAQTAKRFMAYLSEIKENKIIIIITHDANIKEQCDMVLELA